MTRARLQLTSRLHLGLPGISACAYPRCMGVPTRSVYKAGEGEYEVDQTIVCDNHIHWALTMGWR